MRGRRLGRGLICGLALLVAAAAHAEPATVYLLKAGQAAAPAAEVAQYSAADLQSLRSWDQMAAGAVSRAVQGEVRPADALPLFSALLARGPYAGAFGGAREAPPSDEWERGVRFLDAVARLAAPAPVSLVRKVLGDAALVEALRADPSNEAPAAAAALLEGWLREPGEALAALMPALRPVTAPLADADTLTRALQGVDRGDYGDDLRRWLARTLPWDARLYLLAKGDDAATALALDDDALAADWRATLTAQHVRAFVLGPREAEGNAERWKALEAERFVAERPDWGWVAQAAVLAWELREGTALQVTGPAQVALTGGESAPVRYEVRPAMGGSLASPALVWPRSASRSYEGVRCVRDTAAVLVPGPVDGAPRPAGLDYELALTRPGEVKLTFQYSLYGLEIGTVSHPVKAATGDAPWRCVPGRPGPVAGYNLRQAATGDEREVLRRVQELGGGAWGLETEIACDVVTGPAGELPAELEAGADDLARAAVLRKLTGAGSGLAGPSPAGALDAVWVGRRAQSPDGPPSYVLARGTRWLCRRGDSGGVPRWERTPVAAEDLEAWRQAVGPVQDLRRDVAAAAAGAASEAGAATLPAATGTPLSAEAWLAGARELLAEDERLAGTLGETLTQAGQGTLSGEDAARKVGQELVGAWSALEARAAQLAAPAELARASRDLATHLSIATGLARLAEDALWSADATGLDRVRQMLEAQATVRRGMTATPPGP